MHSFFQFLHDQPFFLVFGTVALGMALGRIRFWGLNFGSVICIIIVGLGLSVWSSQGYGIVQNVPDVVKTIFFNLFLFAIAIKIGPQFFSGLQRDGKGLVLIGVIVALLAPVVSIAAGYLFHLPQGAVAGLLAGSNNSSASFGAASAAVASGAARLREGSSATEVAGMLSAAFALSYLIAEVVFVLFMKYLPRIAGMDAVKAEREFEEQMKKEHPSALPGTAEAGEVRDLSMTVRAYRVTSREVEGRTLADVKKAGPHVDLVQIRRGGDWIELDSTTALAQGDEIVIVAPLTTHIKVREIVGPELPDTEARALHPTETVDVVVQEKAVDGKTLGELLSGVGAGIEPVTVFRAGTELPTGPATELKRGDVIRVTGTAPRIDALGRVAGKVVRASHVSDVMSLAIGIMLGAAIGAIPIPVFGVTVTLGAAAILIVGIILSWLKTRHPAFGGPISEGGRSLIEDLGLNTFTAVLGINAGESFWQIMSSGSVWPMVISCIAITLLPAIVACIVGRKVLDLNPALLLGALAGARQCTASLKVAQEVSGGPVPAIGYPVPLAIATVALSIEAYLLATFF